MIIVKRGTGKAKCRMCNGIIEKDAVDIVESGYQSEKHYHHTCIEAEIDKVFIRGG